MNKFWLILTILLLSGCADVPSKKSPLIEVGSPELLTDCTLLKTFTGPESGRFWDTPYLGNFKNEAMEKAEKIGATHILTRPVIDGIESKPVVRAYKCPPGSDAFKINEEGFEEE